MTEWNEWEAWEYAESEGGANSDTLAAAKRFLSAQSYLLAWVEGKVPTGWRRPRRLADFDGKYPKQVLEKAEGIIAERIAKRNSEQTARINAVLSATRERLRSAAANASDAVPDQMSVTSNPPETPAKSHVVTTTIVSTLQTATKVPAVASEVKHRKVTAVKLNDVLVVKKDLDSFSTQLREAKASLNAASDVVAQVTLRLNTLAQAVGHAA